jgi:hypothetical protein
MRCRHCYHKFWVHRLLVLGQVVEPPAKPRSVPAPEKPSVAAQFLAQQAEDQSVKSKRKAA